MYIHIYIYIYIYIYDEFAVYMTVILHVINIILERVLYIFI